MDSGKVRDEEYVLVVDVQGVEDGAYKVLERYPDGSARVRVGMRQVVVDAGCWVECEE